MSITLNDAGTLIGIVVGTAALTLGILNYLRDNIKISVELQWDMKPFNLPQFDENELIGVIRVTNIGRRTTYVSHVAIKLPKGYDDTHLIMYESLQGKKLSEGDEPLIFPFKQPGLEKYKKKWKEVRAQISDSTGTVWYSPRVWRGKPPSWCE